MSFLTQLAISKIDPNTVGVPVVTGDQLFQNGLNLVYFVAGVIAVIVIIVAGIMYAISVGDQSKITRAKTMIIYAVAGLAIILSAFAITNFVIGKF